METEHAVKKKLKESPDSDSDTYIQPGLQKSRTGILIEAAFLNKKYKMDPDGDWEQKQTGKRKENDKGGKRKSKNNFKKTFTLKFKVCY